MSESTIENQEQTLASEGLFSRFNLHAQINQGIADMGYTVPTPIQDQSIPVVMSGRDVLGLAQTGTGKTAAFALPILNHLIEGPRHRIRALVLSPTRELADQTHDAFINLGKHTGLRSLAVYGGVNINPQRDAIKSGRAEILVACPGRLLDHFGQGYLNLSQVEILVLDEADRMLDMGFMPDIRRIIKQVPKERQTLMFSATMPDDIQKFVQQVLKDYETVKVGNTAPARNVEHYLFPVGRHLKTSLLKAMLKEAASEHPVLVFTRTRDRADRLGQQLKRNGFNATSLQGSMTQSSRQAALDGFKSGKYNVLVATDVAARGIDVENISHVINYDLPDNVEDYIHRVGRTGRASKSGIAWSIVTMEDAQTVQSFERVLDVELIEREMEGFDYNAVAPPPEPRHSRGERTHRTHAKRSDAPRPRRGRREPKRQGAAPGGTTPSGSEN